MSPTNISTKRMAVNVGIITAGAAVVSKITGWQVELDANDMLIAVPVVTFIVGLGYRLSRAITTRWPVTGWVLFGSGKEPTAVRPIQR